MRNLYLLLLTLITAMSSTVIVHAQCEPQLKPTGSQWVFNGAVNSSAKFGNALYVGGNFSSLSREVLNFVRLNMNSANPVSGLPAVNGIVTTIISDGSGGWIIGGSFTSVGGNTRNNLARINPAGQVMSWAPDPNGTVSALSLTGTTLYVGGSFTAIGGQTRNNLAKVDISTGVVATTWNPNVNGTVYDLVLSGTTLYTGGSFTSVGAQTRNMIAAVDANSGLATTWNPNANSPVHKILLSGTRIFLGGEFTFVGGQFRNYAAVVSTVTGTALNWNPSPNNYVKDMVLNGNKMVVGGQFSTIGSQTRYALAEVDTSIGNATAANYQLNSGGIVHGLKAVGNFLYAVGSFSNTSGNSNLLKINLANNTIVSLWDASLSGGDAMGIDADANNIYVGGYFTKLSKNRRSVASIDVITDSLNSWNPGVNANGNVTALAADANNVYIGGNFSQIGGQLRSYLGSVNANTGAVNSWNPAPNSLVNALELNGSNLYVGGNFTTIGGFGRNRLAVFDVSTSALGSWNPNLNSSVNAIKTLGTKIYVGGSFTTVGGQTRNRVAEIDASGTLGSLNPNADALVSSLAINGNSLYIGGQFSNIGGQFRPRLAELNLTTGNISSWNPYPNNIVNSISVNTNRVYVAGYFSTIGGQTRNNVAAVDITSGNATSWAPDASAPASHIAAYNDLLVVGGSYQDISNQSNTPFGTQYKLLETVPTVTILGNNPVCSSTSVTYTAATSVSGATYQWKLNGSNVGTNSSTYMVVPSNNDQIQCVITTPSGSCYSTSTATSNTITATISSAITPAITINGSVTMCAGTSATYTATTNITNGYIVWKVGANTMATNTATFTYTPANGDQITAVVNTPANGCYTATSATSNTLTTTVTPNTTPSINISTPSTSVCAGASVTFTASTAVTGGSYQWKVNGLNVGTNSSIYTTSALANGSQVSCVLTTPLGGCYTTNTATSNILTMTVNPVLTPTATITGNNAPCSGVQVTFTCNTNITGGTYQWKVNGNNVGTGGATYAFIPTTTDVVSCVVTAPAGSCYSSSSVTSNSLTITVSAPVTPTLTIAGPNPACSTTNNTYTATTNITGASYQWKRNNINVGTNSATYTATSLANGDVITCVLTVPAVGCFTASTVTSNAINITLTGPVAPTVTITTATTNVCSGTDVTFTATSNVVGATYQWRENGVNVGPNSGSYTITGISTSVSTVSCMIIVPSGACFTSGFAISNTINLNVTQSIVPTVAVTGPGAVCDGQPTVFTTASNVSGGSYQWQANGANITLPYVPASGDVLTATLTAPSGGCYLPQTVTSSPYMVNVVMPTTPTVTVTPSANNICEGTTVVYKAKSSEVGSTYQWKVNGINVGINDSAYTYQPLDNDIVLCITTAPQGCYTTTFAISPMVLMNMDSKIPIPINIWSYAISEIDKPVTVTVDLPNTATTYSVEWKNKGVTFATTTTPTVTFNKTAGIDSITAIVTPTDGCYVVNTSATYVIHGVATSVDELAAGSNISVYPNPFADRIKIRGLEKGDHLTIFDIVGKEVGTQYTADEQMPEHNVQVDQLPAGTYMLKVTGKEGKTKGNYNLRKL